jgi:hypothetical protein
MTDVITAASALVHREGRGDPATRFGTSLLWRLQSGHAHGTPSTRILQIQPDQIQRRPDGTIWAPATTTAMDVGSAAAAAFLLLNEAWLLYDRRCQPV